MRPILLLLLGLAACAGDPTSSSGDSLLAGLDGSWSGSALAKTNVRYPFAADFDWIDGTAPALEGSANIDTFIFDLQNATADEQWVDLELLNAVGRAHLDLTSVEVAEPNLTGHFEMALCWATDPTSNAPECHSEGNFAAVRE